MIKLYLIGFISIAMLINWDLATAGDRIHIDIDKTINYYETPNEITETTITSGIGADELARGIATAGAVNHAFDFATERWQGSVIGAFYEDETAVSFGLAKRFEKIDALWHGSFTENGSAQLITFGASWRF